MRARFLAALGLAALVLAGCAIHPGPTANGFALPGSEHPCDFRPPADVEAFTP